MYSERGEVDRMNLELFLAICRNLLIVPNSSTGEHDSQHFMQDKLILLFAQVNEKLMIVEEESSLLCFRCLNYNLSNRSTCWTYSCCWRKWSTRSPSPASPIICYCWRYSTFSSLPTHLAICSRVAAHRILATPATGYLQEAGKQSCSFCLFTIFACVVVDN